MGGQGPAAVEGVCDGSYLSAHKDSCSTGTDIINLSDVAHDTYNDECGAAQHAPDGFWLLNPITMLPYSTGSSADIARVLAWVVDGLNAAFKLVSTHSCLATLPSGHTIGCCARSAH